MKSKPGRIVLILVLSYKQLCSVVDDGWTGEMGSGENLAVLFSWVSV